MSDYKLAFIVPTKDRPRDLARMLDSFCVQTRMPDQVVIVDASAESVREVIEAYRDRLVLDYVRWEQKPSAAAQRNGGIEKLRQDIDLVCFFDDDQILHPDALAKMMIFWATAPLGQGGAAFNQANYSDERSDFLKRSGVAEKLGLYCRRPGGVAPSGWQSLFGKVSENLDVEWMGSGFAVWRRKILDEHHFDEYFTGYSYLEDLDFSYSVSRKYRLTIVADALFEHYHSSSGRISYYHFGLIEVRNRLHFVRKHHLSLVSCYVGILIRLLMTATTGVAKFNKELLQRATGNIIELCLGKAI